MNQYRELFRSKNIKEEQRVQLTAALQNYSYIIKASFEKKHYLRMLVPCLRYTAVGIKYIYRTLKGNYKN